MTEGLRLLSSLVGHGSVSSFREIDRDLFVGDDELRAYDFVRRHLRTYSQLPELQTIARELGINMPVTNEPPAYYLDRVRNRALFNTLTPIYNDLHSTLVSGDYDGIRDGVAQMYSACRVHAPEQDILSISELSEQILQRYEEGRGRVGLTGIPTGFPTMDLETDGFQDGDLVVNAARPGIGKTHVLIYQCRAALAAGHSVLFVSMEMTLRQIGLRFFAQQAGLDPDLVRRSRLSSFGERRLLEARDYFQSHDRFWLFAGNMGKRTEDLDNVIQEYQPDIVYLDGLYLMKPTALPGRYAKDKYQGISYVVDDLKEIAIRRNRPIVGTTQFNRDGASKPSLENLGYTDSLATHASIITGLYTDPEDKSPRPSMRFMDFLKGREGEAGTFGFNYSFAPMGFSEIVMPEPGQESEEERLQRRRERYGREAVDMDWTG